MAKRAGSSAGKKTATAAPEDSGQISFRVNRDAYRELKRMAVDEDLTIKELVIQAINALRGRKGLEELDL